MQLQLSTWAEVERYLERSTGIIVPIGSTEQHGPTGLLGTDAICAEVIARGTGEAADALVAPTIGVGMAVHHMDFPGSMTLRPSTLIGLIQDQVLSLARHGFRRFFFINGHGGNVPTVQAAFYEIYAAAEGIGGPRRLESAGSNEAGIRCAISSWWQNSGVKALSSQFYGAREGSHATPSEIAVTLYAHPEHAKSATLDPALPPNGRFYGAADYRRRFPDGRMGSDPSLATAEQGRRLYEAAVKELAASYRSFVEGT